MLTTFIQRYFPLSSGLTALLSHAILNEWLAFYRVFWISVEVAYLQCCLVVTWLVPLETAAALASSVHTIPPCSMLRVFTENLHTFCIYLIKINVLLNIFVCFGLVCVVAVTREWQKFFVFLSPEFWTLRQTICLIIHLYLLWCTICVMRTFMKKKCWLILLCSTTVVCF